MSATRITVIGAGTMGQGIAYAALLAGFDTTLVEANDATLVRAIERVRGLLEHGRTRGKVTPEQFDRATNALRSAGSVSEGASNAHLVIEAVPEDIALKQQLLAEAARVAAPDALLASNTSSLSISEIARGVPRPERVIGMHFFNPVHAMQLVEVVRGAATSDASVQDARGYAEAMGKTAIVVQDSPGFASSRLGIVLGLEAMRMVEQGVASAEDIDRAMVLGYNHPVGPLRLTDIVGLDVRLAVADHLHATLGGAQYVAPAILREKVAAGELGKKVGRGFYAWETLPS